MKNTLKKLYNSLAGDVNSEEFVDNFLKSSVKSIVYGRTNTYPFEPMDKKILEYVSTKVNRSVGQCEFLFQMVNGDYSKYRKLEENLKNCFLDYCPSTYEEVEKVLNMVSKSNYFSLF